ncbi:MAG TPA: hypothetical protein VE547_17925 [Mycobacteriales bacterium]|nr:hypothetical protein [Mycobacteriales bacterium]
MTARGPADIGLGLVRFPRPNPVLVVWRWRYELLLAAAVAAGWTLVRPLWTVHSVLVVGTMTVSVPELRRRAARRAWCVVTPHRIRTACKHGWIHSRTGRIPAVLWTRPVDEGEQLLLWCRPGTTADDLAAARPALATACWARDVLVQPHSTRAQLVLLTVVRGQSDRPPATAA